VERILSKAAWHRFQQSFPFVSMNKKPNHVKSDPSRAECKQLANTLGGNFRNCFHLQMV